MGLELVGSLSTCNFFLSYAGDFSQVSKEKEISRWKPASAPAESLQFARVAGLHCLSPRVAWVSPTRAPNESPFSSLRAAAPEAEWSAARRGEPEGPRLGSVWDCAVPSLLPLSVGRDG